MPVTLTSTRYVKKRVLRDVIGPSSAALLSRVRTETIHNVLPNTTYDSQRGALGFDDECNSTPIYDPYLESSSSTTFVKIANMGSALDYSCMNSTS